jgi:hypothetical protein
MEQDAGAPLVHGGRLSLVAPRGSR